MSYHSFDTRTVGRYELVAELERDDGDQDAPWDRECGHGPVSEWTTRAKQLGERVLVEDRRGAKRYYDFAEAVRIAKRDGWNAPPLGEGTKGQRAAHAAEADFNRLRGWCNGDWEYVGIVVSVYRDDEEIDTHAASLWGIESDCQDYLREIAGELFDEVAENYAMDDEEDDLENQPDADIGIESVQEDEAFAA